MILGIELSESVFPVPNCACFCMPQDATPFRLLILREQTEWLAPQAILKTRDELRVGILAGSGTSLR